MPRIQMTKLTELTFTPVASHITVLLLLLHCYQLVYRAIALLLTAAKQSRTVDYYCPTPLLQLGNGGI